MSLIDLPDIQFVDEDVGNTLQNLITTYEAISGRTLYPGDPVRIFLHAIASIIVQQRVLINQTAKSNLLRYATDAILDHLGAFSETTRLQASSALTTLRFTLSAPQSWSVGIPMGTRVTSLGDPKLYFSTTTYAEVAVGATTVEVLAICNQQGVVGNGFLVGQINRIVDPLPFIVSASNVTISSGGAEREDDEAYRQRIRTAPESFSVAGPEGAYQYWAKTASSSIVDIAIESPAAGEVRIVPLLANGELPSSEILAKVLEICNDKRIRPLTDHVTAAAPSPQNYTLDITYWIDQERIVEATAIQTAITNAVSEYVSWQKERLGRAINPSELIRRAMIAGALRVDVTSPVYTTIGETEVAIASSTTVTFGGFEHA
ncbi:baseplate assembly protein [Paenibacillus contaminans]|uniref:Baseplate J protein n=1 Tax=Paenibacillus contaminans TaxID=450362 RepID=A0A329MFZ2_9BACL|nr:baseplate J/gp47 family protein [Paenibacillus contaminans]RAV18839.1 baseplate J protein [Paenibacillus contaminans]